MIWTQMTKDLHKNAVMSLNHEPHLTSMPRLLRLQHPITETRYCHLFIAASILTVSPTSGFKISESHSREQPS